MLLVSNGIEIERVNKVLSEIEASFARNRTMEEIKQLVLTRSKTYLPLSANSARSVDVESERRKDLIGHYVLRLAVCRS